MALEAGKGADPLPTGFPLKRLARVVGDGTAAMGGGTRVACVRRVYGVDLRQGHPAFPQMVACRGKRAPGRNAPIARDIALEYVGWVSVRPRPQQKGR